MQKETLKKNATFIDWSYKKVNRKTEPNNAVKKAEIEFAVSVACHSAICSADHLIN